MTPQEREEGPACLLIYDGECRLCIAAKERLERAVGDEEAREVRFVPYQSERAQRALGPRYRPGRPDVAFLVEPSGLVKEGLDAFLPLASRLFVGRLLLGLLRVPLGRPVATLLYGLIAKYRYGLFGKTAGI